MSTTVLKSLLLILVLAPTIVMINNNENNLFNLQNEENSKNEIYSLNNSNENFIDISNKKNNDNILENDVRASNKDRILLSSLPDSANWVEKNESFTGRFYQSLSDLDEDKIPELITLSDTNGQIQDIGEPGYTKFLEYNETTGTFSNELLSISTAGPTIYYPVEAYADNAVYLLEKTFSADNSDHIFVWKKWNGTDIINVSSNIYIKNDGLYDYDSYDFDLDGNVDLVCNWGYYSGVWTRLELENGLFSSTDYSFYNGGRSIFVEDLDNDGNPNVAVLYAVDKINIYNYNPSINDFQFQQQITGISSLKVMYPWDYDHNGYTDIIVVSHETGVVIYSYEWDSSSSSYVQKLSYTIPEATDSQWTGVPRYCDLLGDGEITMVFDIVRNSRSEIGFITYENNNFAFNSIYNHTDSSKIYFTSAQIDNDPEREILVNYEKNVDEFYTKILDLEAFNEGRYFETFDSDVFLSNPNMKYSWSRSKDNVVVSNGSLKILADETNDDYAKLQLFSGTKSIQIRARVTLNGDKFNYPEIIIKNDNNEIVANLTFSQIDGWQTPQLSYLSDYRGPTIKGVWYDLMINFGFNSLTFYTKKPYQDYWRYIARFNINGNLNELIFYQRNNAEIEMDSIDIFYSYDSDNDGLSDDSETLIYQTDPLDPDTDDDAYTDGDEIETGTDPLDPLSYPKSYSSIFSENFETGILDENNWSLYSSNNVGEWTIVKYQGNYWVQHLYSGSVIGHTDPNILVSSPLNFGDNFTISYVVRPLTYQYDEVGIFFLCPNGTGFRLGTFNVYHDFIRIGASSYYDFAFTADLDKTYYMKVTYVDDTVTVFCNDSQIAQVNNIDLPSEGSLGLRSRGYYGQASHALYDNITIHSTALLNETFDFDIFDTYSNWIRDTTSFTVDTTNSWLHKGTTGSYNHIAKYNKTIQFPFTINVRGRLVSGGYDYTFPGLYLCYPNGSSMSIVFNGGGTGGDYWTFWGRRDSDYGPQAENVWWNIKVLLDNGTQFLYSKSDTDSSWILIAKTNLLFESNHIYVGFSSPWDAVFDIDYIEIISRSTNPIDTDSDGLLDEDEINIYGTNPSNSDTDSDGMPDGWEVTNSLDPLTDDSSLDADSDGLTNLEEYSSGTDPNNSDSDNDGLTDGSEVNTYNTDPNDSDTDSDGMPDGWEVNYSLDPLTDDSSLDADSDSLTNLEEYQNNTDPNNSDSDNDGLTDGSEVNTYNTDPNNSDTDSDGMPDGWEVNYSLDPLTDDSSLDPDSDSLTNLEEYQNNTDPNNSDSDNDDLTDGSEVNTYNTDPNNSDTDSDGMPDGWEVNYSLDPLTDDSSLDADSDGLTNLEEYSSGTNPSNSDTDSDGMPDGWEVNYSLDPLTDDSSLDPDSDSLTNLEEYQNNTDPNNSDSDNDDLTDGSEVNTYNTDPNNSDTDSDGMPDGWEVNYSLDPLTDDSSLDADSDSLTNLEEYSSGTNPSNSDTDSDGMPDGWEVTNSLDPLTDDSSLDADSDGLTNLEEYSSGTDPNNSDSDSDGMPDGWEVNYSLDPLTDDSSLDADSDGLTNLEEYQNNTDPNNSDSDNDGLTDGSEVNTYNTDPNDSDTDSDGMPDGWEVNYSLDPLTDDSSLDADSDSLTNLEEYQNNTDPNNSDSDNDGLTDGSEVNTYGTDPNNSDSDNDGLTDGQEVNTYGTDPNNSDTDGDSMPDDWEANNNLDPLIDDSSFDADSDGLTNLEEYSSGTDPNNSDSDNDGLTDGSEVNTYSTDPLDSDTDSDGMLDGWEVTNSLDPLTDDSSLDADSDSLTNLEEYQNNTDPNNSDSDNDGLTDGSEVNTYNTDPNDSDSDNDGMPDGWEVTNSLDPLTDDSSLDADSDGLTNLEEYSSGTGPTNSDTDSDGMPDGWEVTNSLDPLTDDSSLDTDSDGLTNLEEYSSGTDPNNSDSDSDGMPDGWEVTNSLDPLTDDSSLDADSDSLTNLEEYSSGTDPNDSDTDSDGIPDGSEVNNYSTDPSNSDTDFDGLTDGSEVLYGTDPSNNDTDSDGLTDGSEVNTYSTDPLASDTDFDGIPDGWEVTNGLDPLSDDSSFDPDNDGLTNLEEYSSGTDPNDSDTDSDGIPDGWEVTNSLDPLSDDSSFDPDNDGLTNLEEYSSGTDPNDSDTDFDGLTDGSEVNIYSTDPNNSDTDSDDMPDGWEVSNNLNPLKDDSAWDIDSDGLTNLEEYTSGTDPNDSDTDSDGMSDGWEVNYSLNPLSDDSSLDADSDGLTNLEEYSSGTDPNDSDTDNDGLTDYEEIAIYGTKPNKNDTDGDGVPDGDEIQNGSNPNKPSYLQFLILYSIKRYTFELIFGIIAIIGIIVATIFLKKKRKTQKILASKNRSRQSTIKRAKKKNLLLSFSDNLEIIEQEWKQINDEKYSDKTLFNTDYSNKIKETFAKLIETTIEFNYYFTKGTKYLSNVEWLNIKKRINNLLDKFRDFLLQELEKVDFTKKFSIIKNEIEKVVVENLRNFDEKELLKPFNILNTLATIKNEIDRTKEFIDEFTFSKLTSYWGNLSNQITNIIVEIERQKEETERIIQETKEIMENEKLNQERLEILNKVVSIYTQISLSKLSSLLKLPSISALTYWLSTQNLDIDYIIVDDEIIFEKQKGEKNENDVDYDNEVTNAIDSLLKQFDEWAKKDEGKKID
ncbi:MAG: hypothetical protein K9W45_01130 [Candidatus Heimdallarchaeum aukensis]|uniref:Protective antigen Ca-binding domain-containing protein n=1 Tax=Candidatus Heimdallarchaeum aukensis TaxID=2876573 RepID=A0A9Y1BL64_9ARCH|nr:MAG: hypothetical protein K9W45_01130 [Candidatus Heimdallarchaeum aukensis]